MANSHMAIIDLGMKRWQLNMFDWLCNRLQVQTEAWWHIGMSSASYTQSA